MIRSLIFFALFVSALFSQNPPDINWRTIETEHFKVVYDSIIEQKAKMVAGSLEVYYHTVSKNLAPLPDKLTIILANHTANANGYVAQIPYHSSLFTTPPMEENDYSMNWFEQLTSHELRHSAQIERTRSGVTKFFYYLMGEMALLVPSIATPTWFYEGDAVVTETLLSDKGRGHLPSFTMQTRAMILSDIDFSYTKSYLGSYKDYTPSFYETGYLLNVYIVKKYGFAIWDKVFSSLWATGSRFLTFSGALKAHTGFTLDEIYDEMIIDFKNHSQLLMKDRPITPASPVVQTPKDAYTNYTMPALIHDTLYAVKHGLSSAPTIVSLHNNNETSITSPGSINHLSAAKNSLVWSAQEGDIRYTKQSYSEIYIHTLSTHVTRKLTDKGRYYSPALNSGGSAIAAAHYSTDMQSKIVMLSTEDGSVLKSITADTHSIYRAPSWSSDGLYIVFLSFNNTTNTTSILFWDPCMRNLDTLFTTTDVISNPVLTKEYVLFNSPRSGVDNIHAVSRESGKEFQVTSRPFGSFNPVVDKDETYLFFQNYTANGFEMRSMLFSPDQWIPIEKIHPALPYYFQPLADSNNLGPVVTIAPTPSDSIATKSYSYLSNLINIHTWIPDFCTAALLKGCANDLGGTLYSTNMLMDVDIGAFTYYNLDEKRFSYGAEIFFSKYFPVLFGRAEHNDRSITIRYLKDPLTDTYTTKNITYQSATASAGITIPIQKTSLGISKYLYLTTEYEYRYNWNFSDNRPDPTIAYQPITYSASFGIVDSRTSARDIAPRWGQLFDMLYLHTPINTKRQEQAFAQSTTYLPGLSAHHSTSVTISSEYQYLDNYASSYSLSPYTKGYTSYKHENFYNLLINYQLPLAYFEQAFTRALYIKRVRGGLFYNSSMADDKGNKDLMYSFGITLDFDAHWFRYFQVMPFGLRYSYIPENGDNVFNLRIFDMDI